MQPLRDVPRFYFDYVDPLSWLMDLEIDALAETGAARTVRVPCELRPPPLPLLDPEGAWWRDRWRAATAAAAASGAPTPREPPLVPWTRKAHELVAHATSRGVGDQAHRAVFEAFFLVGEDIGRVDVLVEIGRPLGLDPTETRVVLDVDRYAEEVAAHTLEARAAGRQAPTLLVGSQALQGFHNRDALRTFLRR